LYVKVILVVEFFLYVLGYFSEGLSTTCILLRYADLLPLVFIVIYYQ